MGAADDFAKAMREKRVADAREIAASALTPAHRKAAWLAVRALRESHIDDPPSLPELVALVDQYRAQGDEASLLVTEMIIQADHGPQQIKGRGAVSAKVR